jgi:hypothetical protein
MTPTTQDLQKLKDQKAIAVKELNTLALHRRANANLVATGALTVFGGVLTTIPISIRQRDWKVWTLPFLAAFTFGFSSAGTESKDLGKSLKVLGWISQAAIATALMKQNKDNAKAQLASESN